jgi:carbon monoxide dehydrogenase subunit G
MIKAVINVEAPRHQVYRVLTDYPNYKAWLPGCEQSTLVSSSGNTADTEVVVNSMKKMRMGLRFEAFPTQSLNFKMTSGKELKAYEGSYRLMDAADGRGTVVIAEMEIDAGAMVPRFMVDRVAKKSIDDTGNALKAYIKKLPVEAGPAAETPAAGKPEAGRRRRARKILKVTRTTAGYDVWLMGETVSVKSK